jgi:hypothetical protein
MNGCCERSDAVCVFDRALLARSAACGLAARRSVGERELLECSSPPARINCSLLAALMHERARFALRLPRAGEPLMHAQALRLHCGGLAGLRAALGDAEADVHALVALAQQRHGSLADLPWEPLVAAMRDWAPRRRSPP